ncbi:MAG: ribonuclease R [Peptostreptococcaceae bacterium]|nr:ribonuclease R [Peptostreptococcaceae bacterium]
MLIEKDTILQLMSEKAYKPMKEDELIKTFQVKGKNIGKFVTYLDELVEEGMIVKTRHNKFALPEKLNLVVGKMDMTKNGYGFVVSKTQKEDIFIPANKINGAMNGDTVVARILSKGVFNKKTDGEIVKVSKRNNEVIVGTFEENKNFGFVIPDDKKMNTDVFIPKTEAMGAKAGHKVVASITAWPAAGRNPEGKIVEILGYVDDIGTDILSIIRRHKLPEEFPQKVLDEAERTEEAVSESDIKGRRDLRNEKIITIDGADAKDLDDAVSIKKLENGDFLLGVHIADVTHYVSEGSKMDKEALNRATSVYLVDRVIPMLPRRLSNGICSLNPKVDRLTLSVEMQIDKKGKVIKYEIFESIINSSERMTYKDVTALLENGSDPELEKYEYLKDMFKDMKKLSAIIRGNRENRGAIDFDLPEAKVILNEEREAVDVIVEERGVSNKIIEDFMLACNETVAEHMFQLKIPFVYRVHETPDMEKLENFNNLVHNLGYHIKGIGKEVRPKDLRDLLEQVKGHKEELFVHTLMLRSLKQARYSEDNLGHFGLAAEYYTHFTSPIRRYPDLQIHRIIKEYLNGGISEGRKKALLAIVKNAAERSSERERIAMEAERDTDDLKKAEYMSHHVGEVFDVIITSVASFGFFVQLPNTIEGLVKIASLDDDYYKYDGDNMMFTGERTGKRYRLGDNVKVLLIRVDVPQGEIDFELEELK